MSLLEEGWSKDIKYTDNIRKRTVFIASTKSKYGKLKVERPTLVCTEGFISPEDWTNFLIEWKDFQNLSDFKQDKEQTVLLKKCLEKDQRTRLTNIIPSLYTSTEEQVQKNIQKLFVVRKN